MSAIISLPSNSFCNNKLRRHHHQSHQSPIGSLQIASLEHRYRFLVARRVQSAVKRRIPRSELHAVMNNSGIPNVPPPPSSNFPVWVTWLLGSIFSIIIPAWKLKGGFLQLLGRKVDHVVEVVGDVAETVEDVVEVAENVAETVEKVVSDVADNLPDNSKLKNAALWVENTAKEVGKGSKQAIGILDKIEVLAEEVDKKLDAVDDAFENGNQAKGDEQKEKVKDPDQPLVEQKGPLENAAPVKQEGEATQT